MIPIKLKQQCNWIGVPEEAFPQSRITARIQRAYFKAVFTCATPPELTVLLSAHSRYKLWVNGRFVEYGPCKADHYHRYCDKLHLSTYLKEGENAILVMVTAYPPQECVHGDHKGPDWSVNKACGCCLMLSGRLGDGEGQDISTGNYPWYCWLSEELTPHFDPISHWMGAMEIVDGRKGLSSGEFSGSALPDRWKPAAKRWSTAPSPFGIIPVFDLYERPIPPMTQVPRRFLRQNPPRLKRQQREISFQNVASGVERQTIPPNTEAVLELDAGVLTTGFFRLPCAGGAGGRLEITYAEAYFLPGADGKEQPRKERRDDCENGFLYGHSDVYYTREGEQEYEPFWFRTFRFVRLEVITGDAPLTLSAPYYLETRYPLDEKTRLGETNEGWVRQVWELSLNTLRNCMHETHEDCPYYEQMQYTMDTRLQMLFVYCLSGDTRMARQTIHEYHSSLLPDGMIQSRYPCNDLQVIPAFALQWIFMLEDFYRFTGDVAIVERYRPTVEMILGYYRRRKVNGLVEHLGYWEMIDWCKAWDQNYGCPTAGKHGPSSIQNFLYAYALRVSARLMETVGLPDLAGRYRQESEEIQRLLYERCYHPEVGLYREGPGLDEYSQHAQLFAVLGEAGSAAFRRELMERMHDRPGLIPCSFPLQFYLFRAYEQTGLYRYTRELWELWKRPLDWHMTTIPEEPTDARSDCHAWGSLMLYEFPSKILGVEAEIPGYEAISIRPVALYIHEASGRVSTPFGEVEVSYRIKGDCFSITAVNATGKPCTLYLPDGSSKPVPAGKSAVSRCTIPAGV